MSVKRAEIKLHSIHFINLFPFYTKIKTSILLRVGIEKPAQKNPPNKTQ